MVQPGRKRCANSHFDSRSMFFFSLRYMWFNLFPIDADVFSSLSAGGVRRVLVLLEVAWGGWPGSGAKSGAGVARTVAPTARSGLGRGRILPHH